MSVIGYQLSVIRKMRSCIICTLLLGTCSASIISANEAMDKAWQMTEFLQYKKAALIFEQEQAKTKKGSEDWINASIGLATSLQYAQPDEKADKDKAVKIFDEIIKLTDKNPKQALALLQRARLADQVDYYKDEPDPETAEKLYLRLLKDWPEHPLTHYAVLYLSHINIFSMKKEEASQGVKRLEGWLEKYPDNPLAATQWALIGFANIKPLDDPAKAVAAFKKAVGIGLPKNIMHDLYYWRITRLANMAGDKESEVEYLKKLITDLRLNDFAYESQLLLKEMGEEVPEIKNPFE
ncbi:tol-pal system YbgF family protein [Verrucomicrobiota bacterium]